MIVSRLLPIIFFVWGLAFSLLIPADHELNAHIDRIKANGDCPEIALLSKPYEADLIHEILLRKGNIDGYLGAAIAPYLSQIVESKNGNLNLLTVNMKISALGHIGSNQDTAHARGIIGLAYKTGRFSLVGRVSGDLSNGVNLPDNIERRYKRNYPADMPESYLSYTGDHFSFLAGRNSYSFGSAQSGSLLLGNHGPSLNGFFTEYKKGFFKIEALSAKLNPVGDTSRWFSAMKLAFSVNKYFNIAFMQSVIYSGVGRSFEPAYTIPAFVYYFSQFQGMESNKRDNIFLGMEAEYRINGGRIYGEFLADDFQVDMDSSSRSTQNAIAFLLGCSFAERNRRPHLAVEFVRINSYVYKHMGGLSTNYRLNSYGGTLGHPLGPDAEALYLFADKSVAYGTTMGIEGSLMRLGALNNLALEWDGYGKADQPIPSNPVTTRYTLCAVVKKRFLNRLNIALKTGCVSVRVEGASENIDPFVRINGGWEVFHTISFKDRSYLWEK